MMIQEQTSIITLALEGIDRYLNEIQLGLRFFSENGVIDYHGSCGQIRATCYKALLSGNDTPREKYVSLAALCHSEGKTLKSYVESSTNKTCKELISLCMESTKDHYANCDVLAFKRDYQGRGVSIDCDAKRGITWENNDQHALRTLDYG